MENYKKIRKIMYETQFNRWSHFINNKSPYTRIKSVYYIETASLFLFFTQKFIKSPNIITILYILSGVTGACLLNSSQNELFFIGIFLVFTKGTFDWADGALARRLNKTSFLGHVLDTYGSLVNDTVFRVAIIYYTLGYYPDLMFLLPVIAFTFFITKFSLFSDYMYSNMIKLKSLKTIRNNKFDDIIQEPQKATGLAKWYYRYQYILDSRARSIDFLLLILIIDVLVDYDISGYLLILSILLVLRALITHIASIYYAFKTYGN